MQHEQFSIGLEFYTAGQVWRCTDKGIRTIVAIRLDPVETVTLTVTDDDRVLRQERLLSREQAQQEGWFSGPPYAVAEIAFDEEDILACSLEPIEDAIAGKASG